MATPREGYRTKDGQKAPSVTTILGRFKDSGGLIKWAYKQGREHENLAMRLETQARMRDIEKQPGVIPAEVVGLIAAELLGDDWSAPLPEAPAHLYDKVQEAALAGTIAHDLIEAYILDGVNEGERFAAAQAKYTGEDPDVKRRAWNSYQQFRKWLANTNIAITHTEMGSVSEKHKFGGTLDAVGLDADGNVVLVDWKTSNAVYGDYLIQLAAYSLLLEENQPELAPKGYHLLRVAKETADFAHHYYGELEKEKKAFLLMRELYELVYAIGRRA